MESSWSVEVSVTLVQVAPPSGLDQNAAALPRALTTIAYAWVGADGAIATPIRPVVAVNVPSDGTFAKVSPPSVER